jgi:hypothetical protein
MYRTSSVKNIKLLFESMPSVMTRIAIAISRRPEISQASGPILFFTKDSHHRTEENYFGTLRLNILVKMRLSTAQLTKSPGPIDAAGAHVIEALIYLPEARKDSV